MINAGERKFDDELEDKGENKVDKSGEGMGWNTGYNRLVSGKRRR